MRKNKEIERLLGENNALRTNNLSIQVRLNVLNEGYTKQAEELKALRHKGLRDEQTISALQYAMCLTQGRIRELQGKTNETNFKFANGKWEKVVEDNLALGV